ncbi:MAG: SWIM zinc finger domain-containing protein [Sphingobacteriales bacterium]
MELTLKNYAIRLSKDIILLAKKNKVRECDETEKGHFVAYVDEGGESFDVSLTVKTGNKIALHTCDCDSNVSFCRHKAALLIHLATGEKTKDTVKIKKKRSKAEALLEATGPDELKAWVNELIGKNKDIELSFVHHFSVKEQLTPPEVTKITQDAIKAVAGNKKTIDLTQLKKLVELWSQMHAPVITHYQENPKDEKSFLNFHTMLESCLAFQVKADTSSNRIPKFVDGILQKSQEPVRNLQNEDSWDKAISHFISVVPDGVNKVRLHYLIHLKNIIDISDEDRKIKIVDLLAMQFGKSNPDEMFNGPLYCKFIFEITEGHGLFPKHYRLFKPLRFDNEYNQKLIGLLIENNHLAIAKKYCNEQIQSNFREEYNVPYLKSLKEIFVIEKDNENLAKILSVLFPYTFEFDDYLFIINTLPEEERKKWRTKILARARNASRNRNNPATEFCFKLMNYEKGYKKMIEYIESYTPFSLILQYFEPMVLAEKNKLLEAIVRKSDDYVYTNVQNDAACFPELFAIAVKHYSAGYLKTVISNAERHSRYYYSPNRFLVYMKGRLNQRDND